MFFIRLILANTLKKIGGYRARLREKDNFSRYRAWFEGNLLRFARTRAHVRALITRKSCAVGMHNAILAKESGKYEIKILKFSHRGSRSPDNAELGHFTLLFCRGRQ